MLFRKYVTGTAAAIFILLWANCAGSQARASESGWRLEQSGELAGVHTVLVTHTGMKADNLKGGYSIVMHAPDWNVTVYNTRGHVYWTVPYKAFKGEVAGRVYASDRQELLAYKWHKSGKEVVAGQSTAKYEIPQLTKEEAQKQSRVILAAWAWVLEDNSMPLQIRETLGKIYMLPPLAGLPLKAAYKTQSEEKIVGTCNALDTGKATRVTVTPDQFLCPKGYKLAATEGEAYVDPLSKQAFEGFSDWYAPAKKKRSRP